MRRRNILVTGRPGCGKTTLILEVTRRLKRPLAGFVTREIRKEGRRVGFFLETFDGKRGVLAHVDGDGRLRVGKYHVNLETIDRIAVPALCPKNDQTIIVIDEIGKMECLSEPFREAALKALDIPNQVLGSIPQLADPYITGIRFRHDVRLIAVRPDNRADLIEKLVHHFMDEWKGKS